MYTLICICIIERVFLFVYSKTAQKNTLYFYRMLSKKCIGVDSLRIPAGALSGPNQLPGGETWQPLQMRSFKMPSNCFLLEPFRRVP